MSFNFDGEDGPGCVAVSAPAYDRIGLSYSEVRRAEPRFEAAIWRALGDAKRILSIGAGAGSYEPRGCEVVAVEPSSVMIVQRPADVALAIQGTAESIPLDDKSVDATMGVFTMQHWDDVDRGLAEIVTRHSRANCLADPRLGRNGRDVALSRLLTRDRGA